MSTAYDPDAPEGSKRPGSAHVSRADLKWLIVIVPLLAIGLFPIYNNLMEDGRKKMCSTNIQLIGKAIQNYAALNDNRFPPIYESGAGGNPSLLKGVPINWMTLVEPSLSARGKTICPSAAPGENSQFYSSTVEGPKDLSYGMYFPLETMPDYQLSNPATLILLTETASAGASNTFNPVRFEYPNGDVLKDDGFVIGYDNKPDGNFGPTPQTKSVTRLAFSNTSDGNFENPDARGRHGGINHVIFADGSGGSLQAADARVRMLNEEPTGRWRTK